MKNYRIIEDSLGNCRVQFRLFFIWWTVQDSNYAGNYDAVFRTKADAEDHIKKLLIIHAYKKVVKIHKVENI